MNLLAENLAQAADPAVLARAVGIERLDGWQERVLRSTAKRILMLCSRQAGKSTVAGLLAVHEALFSPGSTTLLVSPSQRQSARLFESAILPVYRALGRPVSPIGENQLGLRLENGSSIHALPGDEARIRGFAAVALLVCDEAARIEDELMAAVRPMLAVSNGRLIALSTPWGREGWFYGAWEAGGDEWERVFVPADECPRIDPGFLETERRALGERRFAREYLCRFSETDAQFFPDETIARAFEDVGVGSLFGDLPEVGP